MLLAYDFIIAAAPTTCNTDKHKIETKDAEVNHACLGIMMKVFYKLCQEDIEHDCNKKAKTEESVINTMTELSKERI